MTPKTHDEQLAEDQATEESGQEFSDTPQGQDALDRWARAQAD